MGNPPAARMSHELFRRHWQAYRTVVTHDLMEHSAMAAVLEAAIREWAAGHDGALRLADLGCGDMAVMAPILRRLHPAAVLGLDACESVLPLAGQSLGEVPFPCRWVGEDLLGWIRSPSRAPGERWSVICAQYVLHHLEDTAKEEVLRGLRDRLVPGGLLLVADVFRRPGESLPAYIDRMLERVEGQWTVLPAEARALVGAHVRTGDRPMEAPAFLGLARRCGWRGRWIWRGSHDAEALLLLTPVDD